MKKSIIVLLLVFMAGVNHAQVSWDTRVGVNLSGFSEGDMTMKFGGKAGVGMEYAFSKLFAIRPALFFSMKGASDAKNPFDFSPENAYRLNYVELPVLASFRFTVSEKVGLALNAGPSFSYCVSRKTGKLSGLNSFDAGANMGLDLVLSKKYVIGVEGQYGLTEIATGNKSHNINYSLMFGYKF